MYLKHPLVDEDGTVTVATPQGSRTLAMVAGVVDWPDELPVPIYHGQAWAVVEAPAALHARKAEEEKALLAQLAAKYGLALVPSEAPSDPKPSRKKAG